MKPTSGNLASNKVVPVPPPSKRDRNGAIPIQGNTASRKHYEALGEEHCSYCRDALASAAHELKTPLAIMEGYLQLLLAQKLGPLNDRQIEVLSEMQSSGVRLANFVQNLLTYATLKVDRSHLAVYPEGVSPVPASLAPEPELFMRSEHDGTLDNVLNFVECMRTRKSPNANIHVGFQAARTSWIGNIALRRGLKVAWDPTKGRVS